MLTNEELIKANIQNISAINSSRIYKYVGFQDAIKYVLINNNTIKFSSPEDFNDPFDCHEGFINFENTPSFNTLDGIAKNILGSNYSKEVANRTNKLINNSKEKSLFFRKVRDNYKVSCFSKKYDNILMWSHYANKHNGICIGFDFPIDVFPKDFILMPVIYKNTVSPFDMYADPHRIILHWLTTKSFHWAYEQEVRAIINTKSSKLSNHYVYELEKEYIKEIIFGCNISDYEIIKTMSLIKKNGYKNILVKKMVIDTEMFSLKEEIIADIQNFKNRIKNDTRSFY